MRATRFGISVTPEAVVLSPEGKVLYRGRIDDRYSLDSKRREEASTHDLADAIEAAIEGKEPAVRETTAFGCPLPTPKKTERRPAGGEAAGSAIGSFFETSAAAMGARHTIRWRTRVQPFPATMR